MAIFSEDSNADFSQGTSTERNGERNEEGKQNNSEPPGLAGGSPPSKT
jgi:hypothetical protein